MQRKIKRIYRPLTPAEKRRITIARKKIKKELPELLRRNQMMADARREETFSGQLRRAIHASKRHLLEIGKEINVKPMMLVDFLTGERPLQSDVLDRLLKLLGYKLNSVHHKKTG